MFIDNIKSAFGDEAIVSEDRGDLVQTVILTAGFAIAGFAFVAAITNALNDKGEEIRDNINDNVATMPADG